LGYKPGLEPTKPKPGPALSSGSGLGFGKPEPAKAQPKPGFEPNRARHITNPDSLVMPMSASSVHCHGLTGSKHYTLLHSMYPAQGSIDHFHNIGRRLRNSSFRHKQLEPPSQQVFPPHV